MTGTLNVCLSEALTMHASVYYCIIVANWELQLQRSAAMLPFSYLHNKISKAINGAANFHLGYRDFFSFWFEKNFLAVCGHFLFFFFCVRMWWRFCSHKYRVEHGHFLAVIIHSCRECQQENLNVFLSNNQNGGGVNNAFSLSRNAYESLIVTGKIFYSWMI